MTISIDAVAIVNLKTRELYNLEYELSSKRYATVNRIILSSSIFK